MLFARRPPISHARRWTINGDFLGLSANGVARYGRETTLALDALIGNDHPLTRGLDITLVSPRSAPDFVLKNIPVQIVPEWRRVRLPQVWCQWQLPQHVDGGLISFCNLAPVAIARQIVCIHDLHTRMMPHDYGRGFRLAHRIVLPMLGRRVRAITTVSELSRAHLAEHGVAVAAKVTVTFNGADHARGWDSTRSKLSFDRQRPFVLGFGRPQPYKNSELFWRIAAALDQRGVDIVLAGELSPATAALYGPHPANLRLLGRIGDDDLAFAMSQALCLLFPSRIEGFGLPAAEAMVRGCPIIASTSPCLPEICGDAALFADPDKPEQWLAAIDQLQASPNVGAELIARGYRRATLFSWRRIGETYLELMAGIDGYPRAAPTAVGAAA